MDKTIKKAAELLIRRRYLILGIMLAVCALCGLLALRVPINADMTKYLPDSSQMKQGIDLMAEEFSGLPMPSTIRVMCTGMTAEEAAQMRARLGQIEYVDSVAWSDTEASQRTVDGVTYSLFTVSTNYAYRSEEERSVEKTVRDILAEDGIDGVMKNDDVSTMDIPPMVYAAAVILLMIVLFAMCGSWAEPFLFLAAIGIAIVINMGTNIILGSVSQVTYSIGAVLQLVLSMDYSIILMNRYRQEKRAAGTVQRMQAAGTAQRMQAAGTAPEEAMKRALVKAFGAITGSGLTTFVGLLMLLFMNFKIGMDIGLVLAKGVLWSMICVLTVLPALILHFDRLVEKTAKKMLHLPTDRVSGFEYRFRFVIAALFVLLFFGSRILEERAEIAYSLNAADPIAEIFTPANPIVLLYANEDEEAAAALASTLEEEGSVQSVSSYATTLGRQRTAQEMTQFLKESAESYGMEGAQALEDMLSEQTIGLLYLYGKMQGVSDGNTMSAEEMFSFVTGSLMDNPLLSAQLDDEMKEQVRGAGEQLAAGKDLLIGKTHSLMMISISLPPEGAQTTFFIKKLQGFCDDMMEGTYYMIGNSPMNVEMQEGFGRELLLITILTAVSIFLVVAFTFRHLLIPLILVSLVQCGVYLTITTTWLIGYHMYYLAVLIVQCILMGAMVDYGILFTTYYRELRETMDVPEALRGTYAKSVHTILTSGLFMALVTGVIGVSPVEPTIGQICQSISIGAICASLLILFVLPAILTALDRWVVHRGSQAGKTSVDE